MRIAHVITAPHRRGGMEVFLSRLAIGMQRAGVKQLVFCQPPQAAEDDLAAYLRAADVPVITNSLHRKKWLGRWQLQAELKKFQPDIVLSWLPRAAQLVPKKWRHVAQVGWYRGLDCYERAGHMVVPTPDMQRHFTELGFAADRIHVLPHFTDVAVGKKLDRASLNVPEHAPLLLGLGRLDAVKGFDVAIAALPQVPNAYLCLAGVGAMQEALMAQARDLCVDHRVRFLGWRSDGADLLATADMLIVPSRQEALGLVILEAWQQGVPVVATRSGGPLHLIEDGINGLLCEIDDPADMAKKIQLLIDQPALRTQFADHAKTKLQSEFTEKAAVKAYLDCFQKLI